MRNLNIHVTRIMHKSQKSVRTRERQGFINKSYHPNPRVTFPLPKPKHSIFCTQKQSLNLPLPQPKTLSVNTREEFSKFQNQRTSPLNLSSQTLHSCLVSIKMITPHALREQKRKTEDSNDGRAILIQTMLEIFHHSLITKTYCEDFYLPFPTLQEAVVWGQYLIPSYKYISASF